MKVNHPPSSNNTSFQAYLKFKSSPKNISRLRDAVQESNKDIVLINHKKGKNKESIELLSGSHLDKFIKLIGKMYFRELKTNLPKYIGEKPEHASVTKYTKKLNKKSK